jgi:hypothetical protein
MSKENADGLTGVETDIETLRAKVLDEIKTLALLVRMRRDRREPPSSRAISVLEFFSRYVLHFDPVTSLKRVKRVDELTARGRTFLELPETRRALCPALRRVED